VGHITVRYIPEDRTLHNHRRENSNLTHELFVYEVLVGSRHDYEEAIGSRECGLSRSAWCIYSQKLHAVTERCVQTLWLLVPRTKTTSIVNIYI
jgi:hypothetical protein